MALRDRLDTLRRQSGATSEPSASQGSDLARRLERLGAQGAGRHVTPSTGGKTMDASALAAELDARALSDQLICREAVVAPEAARAWCDRGGPEYSLPEQSVSDPKGVLIVDTETSGLAGGTGTVAFLVGLVRLEGEALVCRQYLLTGFGGEPALYRCLSEEARTAETVLSYNGKAFDAPLIRDRACLNRTASPLAALAHIDLLAPVRRLFGARWPDCRLSTAEQRLLGEGRGDDLPGSEAPLAWFDFIHRGETQRLPGVLSHNRRDLISLARLLPIVARAHQEPLAYGADPGAAARAWQRCGDEDRARRLLAMGESALTDRGRLELARLARRAGDLETAVRVWRDLAERGEARAIEALAKHYEHRVGDCERALHWARALAGEGAAARCRRLEAKRVAVSRQVELGL